LRCVPSKFCSARVGALLMLLSRDPHCFETFQHMSIFHSSRRPTNAQIKRNLPLRSMQVGLFLIQASLNNKTSWREPVCLVLHALDAAKVVAFKFVW